MGGLGMLPISTIQKWNRIEGVLVIMNMNCDREKDIIEELKVIDTVFVLGNGNYFTKTGCWVIGNSI